MKIYLSVPYIEAQHVKNLGAWFCGNVKRWYIPPTANFDRFRPWLDAKAVQMLDRIKSSEMQAQKYLEDFEKCPIVEDPALGTCRNVESIRSYYG